MKEWNAPTVEEIHISMTLSGEMTATNEINPDPKIGYPGTKPGLS